MYSSSSITTKNLFLNTRKIGEEMKKHFSGIDKLIGNRHIKYMLINSIFREIHIEMTMRYFLQSEQHIIKAKENWE